MRFDLHVHTSLSPCSVLGLREILDNARDRGLDGVCITDHGTAEMRRRVREGPQEDGLCVLVGTEYDTPDGDFLLFGPLVEPPHGLSARDALRWVERAGGVAVAAHPCRRARAVRKDLIGDGLCRVAESLNGRNTAAENRAAQQWQNALALVACGGSDAHNLDELGRVVTVFEVPVRTQAELVRALKEGSCRPAWNPRSADRGSARTSSV